MGQINHVWKVYNVESVVNNREWIKTSNKGKVKLAHSRKNGSDIQHTWYYKPNHQFEGVAIANHGYYDWNIIVGSDSTKWKNILISESPNGPWIKPTSSAGEFSLEGYIYNQIINYKDVKGFSFLREERSTNRNAYPDDGEKGGYWYVYKGVDNQAPKISGSNLDLGSKIDDFEIEYVITDVDGDTCTVDILVDDIKKISNKSVSLGIKNIYEVNLNEFTLGRHKIKIVSKDSKEATSERIYIFSKSNTAPTISGTDESLGGKSTAFTQTYRVTDRNNDDISVVVTLDDLEISNVSSAQNKELSITITNEQLQAFEIGSMHTITIRADDSKGGVAYRRYTFTRVNTAPTISGTDANLGDKKETFSVSYSLIDTEKDQIYCKVYVDSDLVRDDIEVVDGQSYTYAIPHDDFIRLPYGEHRITIEAWDDENVDNKQYRIYTFKRVSNGLEVEVKINEFTVQPKKIIAVPHGIFAEDSIKTIKVCNNYLDTSPTWEDATTESKAARAYTFNNETKTAEKWSIGIKIIVENGSSGVSSVLRGVKGGYE